MASFEEFVANEFASEKPTLSNDIEQAASEVSDYVQKIIYEMDIEATIETSNNRRQINLQLKHLKQAVLLVIMVKF